MLVPICDIDAAGRTSERTCECVVPMHYTA